jgi:hypothetical protein
MPVNLPVAAGRVRLRQPLAFGVYTAAGLLVVLLTSSITWNLFRLDLLQQIAIWVAVVFVLFVLSGETPASERVRHRAIWSTLIAALLFSFLQIYVEYLSLQDRLAQLHSDVIAQANDVQVQLLRARYEAESLNDDLLEWSTATGQTRVSVEARVASDLALLDGRTQEVNSNLQGLVRRLGTTTVGPQGESVLTQSTFASVRNLADDSVLETGRMVQALQDVKELWANPSGPGFAERIQFAVNPKLWTAIDNSAASAQHLSEALGKATSVPIADLLAVMAVLNLSAVLFPWLLLLLFIYGRRDNRIRQIYMDLWALGGQTKSLLVRVLDGVPDEKLTAEGHKDLEVRRALEDRTFSDLEYLLCLSVLTTLLTAGWHLVLYPLGTLGLAQLLVNGVSVREFALYIVGNLNVVTLGFLGAYFYGIGILVRRFFASDLYPSAFLQMIVRLVTVFVISLVVTILLPIATAVLPDASRLTVPFSGLPAPPNGGRPLDGAMALTAALAFFFGVWTRSFFGWVPRLISGLPIGINKHEDPQSSVAQLEGVDIWVEGRLAEEGIETVQAMATVPIERLVRRTYFATARVVGWVNQAMLYMHAGNAGQWMLAFRSAGIHTATDLLDAVGYAHALRTRNDQPVRFVDVEPAIRTLATATASDANTPKLPPEVIFEVCTTLWGEPNLVYALNFYNAHRVGVGEALVDRSVGAIAEAARAPVAVEPVGNGQIGSQAETSAPPRSPAGERSE